VVVDLRVRIRRLTDVYAGLHVPVGGVVREVQPGRLQREDAVAGVVVAAHVVDAGAVDGEELDPDAEAAHREPADVHVVHRPRLTAHADSDGLSAGRSPGRRRQQGRALAVQGDPVRADQYEFVVRPR